jgi:amidase
LWHFNSGAAVRTSYAVRGTSVDILLAPSAEDEAPAGLVATGDPISNRMWTLLANPCVHVPLRTGASGMPLGVTLIGPRWADARTLTAAHLPEQTRQAHE